MEKPKRAMLDSRQMALGLLVIFGIMILLLVFIRIVFL